MSNESEVDTSRAVVQTYVPTYQRDDWDRHAEKLDMSRSEFVRAMVQAGRRGFGTDSNQDTTGQGSGSQTDSSAEQSLEEQIVDQIEAEGALGWGELVTELTGDIETRIEQSLESLQDAGRVRHSGPAGGYVLEEEQ